MSTPPSAQPCSLCVSCCYAFTTALQVRAATQQWDGSGSFVFTSSMSVCATEDGSEVSENCPLVPQGKAPGAVVRQRVLKE
jgi:hypothetical protein